MGQTFRETTAHARREMFRNSEELKSSWWCFALRRGGLFELLARTRRRCAFGKKHPVRVVSVPRKTPIAVTFTAMDTFKESSLTTTPVGTPSNGSASPIEQTVKFTSPDPPLAMCEHGRYVDVWKLGEALGITETTTTTTSSSSQLQQEDFNTSNARKKQRTGMTENTQNKKNGQLLRSG